MIRIEGSKKPSAGKYWEAVILDSLELNTIEINYVDSIAGEK